MVSNNVKSDASKDKSDIDIALDAMKMSNEIRRKNATRLTIILLYPRYIKVVDVE